MRLRSIIFVGHVVVLDVYSEKLVVFFDYLFSSKLRLDLTLVNILSCSSFDTITRTGLLSFLLYFSVLMGSLFSWRGFFILFSLSLSHTVLFLLSLNHFVLFLLSLTHFVLFSLSLTHLILLIRFFIFYFIFSFIFQFILLF